jgi:hypothetical protein
LNAVLEAEEFLRASETGHPWTLGAVE